MAASIVVDTESAAREDADIPIDLFAFIDEDGGAAEVVFAIELLAGSSEGPRADMPNQSEDGNGGDDAVELHFEVAEL